MHVIEYKKIKTKILMTFLMSKYVHICSVHCIVYKLELNLYM